MNTNTNMNTNMNESDSNSDKNNNNNEITDNFELTKSQFPTGIIGMWLFALICIRIILEAQCAREIKPWQTCHEIAKKSSIIVPLGAPFILTFYSHGLRTVP